MIKMQDMTPKVYYDQSRDFQFIGRLFDVMLNSVASNVRLIDGLRSPEALDERLLELCALTLGLSPRHRYDARQLAAICSSFATIMRGKGSAASVNLIVDALVAASGLRPSSDGVALGEWCAVDEKDSTRLLIRLPYEVRDLTLLNDLLDYVLPAGMTCDIVRNPIYVTNVSTNVGVGGSAANVVYENELGYDLLRGETTASALTTATGESGKKTARPELYMNNYIWRPADAGEANEEDASDERQEENN